MISTLALFSLAPVVFGSPARRCTGTISSIDDVSSAIECTTININSFTVSAGQTFSISAPTGATINVPGDVTFGYEEWAGPLFQLTGTDITFNGNGYTFDGQGDQYWDGLGSGGSTKPPHDEDQIFGFGNDAALTVSKVTVNNSDGNSANSLSDGKAAGHNTDGFDVSVSDLTIEDSTVINQDDCLAINKGSNIVFQRNSCIGGHGISVDSIASDVTVNNVQILDNTVTDNAQGFRIKTDATATGLWNDHRRLNGCVGVMDLVQSFVPGSA
ncbi:endo-polygalacturonase [Rhizoctonia solani AG-3 Rhs1AP]|uniref:endo-polygalacturonase n=1 Tax=Rhizoctonia solani AG-3 Rhs1AP TaxID=1086054 RepID=X8JPN6_9AGAM|nr:endo-polygalacturonase [Rhizoctonia solani AG-3 Rhs1AP]